jgi:hypothetical protein
VALLSNRIGAGFVTDEIGIRRRHVEQAYLGTGESRDGAGVRNHRVSDFGKVDAREDTVERRGGHFDFW